MADFSLQIGGKVVVKKLAPRVPIEGEFLSFYDEKGVQEFFKVTRVVWCNRLPATKSFSATVYAVKAQP